MKSPMSLQEIETAISQLPANELSELVDWLAAHHAQVWDQRIANDLESGRLDKVLEEVDRDYQAGLAQPL